MRQRVSWKVGVGLLMLSATALAVEAGTTMYIRAKDTHLMKSSAPTAAVLEVLQPGQQVRYEGPDVKSGWHKVAAGNIKGVVFRSCLSLTPPVTELEASVGTTDTKAFQSSGAATKAVSPGAEKYGKDKGWSNEAEQLTAAEKLAEGVSASDVEKQAKKHGLYAGRGAK